MRVVLDARTVTPHYPGIGRYTLELARALTARVELTLLINPQQAAAEKLRVAQQVVIHPGPRALAQQWELPARLRALKPDVYHSPYYFMPYWPGQPTVLTVYDLIPLYSGEFSAGRRAALLALHGLALRAARNIIAISQWVREDFIERFHLRPERIVAIPLAVDARFAPQTAEAVAGLRREMNLPSEYLLTVGGNKPHKNLARLIQAYATLPQSTPPLVLAGQHEAKRFPEAREAAQALGERIIFLGRVPEAQLPLLYASALAYVNASLMEGYGLPVLEAMACGAPVACAQSPGLAEAAGDSALLFNPKDSDSIADALKKILADSALRANLRVRGLARAQTQTWPKVAEATLAVYTDAITNNE